jgi:hypothetical protein
MNISDPLKNMTKEAMNELFMRALLSPKGRKATVKLLSEISPYIPTDHQQELSNLIQDINNLGESYENP